MGRSWTSLGCALALVCGCAEPPVGVGGPPIVLVTVDTLRADRLGSYGYYRDTTPALDRFAAEEAVLFENAITPMATTLPAHVSLMTGTYPGRHRVFHNLTQQAPALQEDGALRTLAQMLAERGYLTAAFVSATPVKDHTGIDAGFQDFDQPLRRERLAFDTTNEAIDWIEDARGAFFLWVHYFDPHDPYDPPPRFRERFRTGPRVTDFLEARGVTEHDEKLLGQNNRYDGEVLYLDKQVHRLFEALRAAGHWDAAAVVFTADHGEGLGQHGWVGHGRVYNEQIFVPLLVKLPGGERAGSRVARFASLVDVLPTLVGRLGLPIGERERDQLEGIDLFDPQAVREAVFSERVHRDRGWEPGPKYTLTGPDWKYHHLPEGDDALYDMREDRFELRNVIAEQPELAALLRERISAIVARDERPAREQPAQELPPERLEELRELGYVD